MAKSKLTSGLKAWYIKAMPGMNNKVEDLEAQTKWVELAQNCRYEAEPGTVSKRPPVSFYNSTATGTNKPVMSKYRYYTKGASAGKSIKICNSQAYVGTDASGAWTSIRTGLTEGKRTSFVVYKNILIASNGYDQPWCYDGAATNTTWELGSCKAALAGDGAGNVNTGTHSYRILFSDDAAGSNVSGISFADSNEVTTVSGSDGKVSLTNIPIGPSGYTFRHIYRTNAGGSTYYRLEVAATPETLATRAATTYTDNIADDTVEAYPSSVGDEIPVGSILKLHRERLFITGDPSNPNKIYYAEPYRPWYMPITTNTNYMEIDADDGDQIMGVPIQLGTMCCIKKNNIRKLHITSATSGADPATWYADDIIAFVGTPAQWSVQQTPYGVMFLGWDHWYKFDGVNATPIVDEFNTDNILSSAYSDTVSHWSQLGTLLWAYTDTTNANTYHDKVGRYNFKRQALSIDVLADDSSGNAHGINCFSSNVGDDENGELYYGSSTQGWVYKAEQNELQYALTTKDQCSAGTSNNTFVGGTAVAPSIEIGSASSASTIPDNVCIFWDDDTSTPGATWDEVTTEDDKFIMIDEGAAAGTDGTVGTSTGDKSTANFINYRMFKSNTVTTTEFPNGAIAMYNQSSDPVGWQAIDSGYYVKLNSDLTTASGTITVYPEEGTGVGDTIENEAKFRFIKKVGDSDTWDGDGTKRVYCPYYGVTYTFNACVGGDDTALEFTDNGHGLSDGDEVTFKAATLPTGVVLGTVYFVVNKDTNTFQIAATPNGTAIVYTDAGTTVTWATAINGFVEVTKAYDDRYLKTDTADSIQLGGATAAGFDIIQQPDVEHTSTGTGVTGTDANVYDGLDATSWDISRGSNSGGGSMSTTIYSTHTWETARTITSVKFKANASITTTSGASGNEAWFAFSVEYYDDSLTWQTVVGSSDSGAVNGDATDSGSIDTTLTGLSLANVTAVRAYGYVKTTKTCADDCAGSESASCSLYEVEARSELDSVSVKLVTAVLGKMKDYNAALTTAATEGVWESPQAQIDSDGLNQLFWNESKGTSDDVQLFLRTAATSAALASIAATCANVGGEAEFTDSVGAHGLLTGDRVSLSASTTPPTNFDDNHMYYVESVSAADKFTLSLTSGGAAIAYSDAGTTVKYKAWSEDTTNNTYTDPNGATINNTANVWFEYAIAFTAADTTVSNPKVYFTNGFVVKMTYDKELTVVETAVPFKYEIGFRNFDQPFVDKLFKKIATWHETQSNPTSSFTVYWKLDIEGSDSSGNRYDEYDPGTSGEKAFVISMASYPRRWETFFPSIATGRSMSFMIYKNDLETFKLKELKGLYTAEPVIV